MSSFKTKLEITRKELHGSFFNIPALGAADRGPKTYLSTVSSTFKLQYFSTRSSFTNSK